MIGQKLIEAAGSGISTGEVAEAIDFDGTNDYLSRSSDLTGNADGKTFTFSAWVWLNNSATTTSIYQIGNSSSPFYGFQVKTQNNILEINGWDTSGTFCLRVDSGVQIQAKTWMHFVFSCDLTNSANRYLYVNDVTVSPTYNTYVNTNINFTMPLHGTQLYNGTDRPNGRLSNVYLDHTYRNLSVEANRRLFVTADLKPAAGQASLNPILYLPMDDPTAPGANAGTGGDFTLTGTIARSGRGPNQYNAPYSDLDGSADYLSRTTAPTGIADGKQGTFACTFNVDATSLYVITSFSSSTNLRFIVKVGSGEITVEGYDSTGAQVFTLSQNAQIKINRNYVLVLSFDTSDSNKYHLYVNGVQLTTYFTIYTSTNVDYAITTTPRYYIGANPTPSSYFNGRLGALWFNTSYIDLSQASNLAKFVTGTGIDAKPVDLGANGELPTGTAPLIYLPMYGNNAGKNYGTGGDFTVNSGPYTGARGPNEFWGNKANFDGTTGYLSRTSALSGVSDSTTLSLSFWVKPDTTASSQKFFCIGNSAGTQFYVTAETAATGFNITLRTSANGLLAAFGYSGGTLSTSVASHICFMVNMTNASLRGCYLNGASVGTFSVYNTGSGSVATASPRVNIAARTDLTPAVDVLDGYMSEFYFTTSYIDFSQEANRLKFRDAFGNPVDLTQQIEDAAIPNPAIYMRFPPTSFGTNSGTGGDFTVNGTITDGGNL